MPLVLFKNLANLIVLFRVLLVFVIIFLLNSPSLCYRISALILLIFIALLDWLDGYVARRFNISSKLGGLIDTLGDRITENLLLIFFAYKQLIPIAVPLIFVVRSFIADFIRHYYCRNGTDTFTINKSKLGLVFVASIPSRVLYLIFKIVVFSLASLILILESFAIAYGFNSGVLLIGLKQILFYGSIILVLFNLLRFFLLLYDTRFILKEIFNGGS